MNVASVLVLDASIYSEPTIYIRNVASLTAPGASNAAAFDCSRAALSTAVTVLKLFIAQPFFVTFQRCSNLKSAAWCPAAAALSHRPSRAMEN